VPGGQRVRVLGAQHGQPGGQDVAVFGFGPGVVPRSAIIRAMPPVEASAVSASVNITLPINTTSDRTQYPPAKGAQPDRADHMREG